MGIQPSEAGKLTWQEYQGLLWNWNDRHNPEEERADPPDPEFMKRRQSRIAHAGLARMLN